MARKKTKPEETASMVAYLKLFANVPVDMMQLSPLRKAAEHAFLRGEDPLQAMLAYADANGIEHNEVKEGSNA